MHYYKIYHKFDQGVGRIEVLHISCCPHLVQFLLDTDILLHTGVYKAPVLA